jgi:formiminotetrahydrofolate cyclodeaminase
MTDLLDLTVREWLDELAGPKAAPGGGSALAVTVANAAAIVAMAARVTGDPALAERAEALRTRTAPLAQLDADTYRAALADRDFAQAADPPLEIARCAVDVAALAATLAAEGAEAIRADAIAAGALAAAAVRGTVAMVEVNLAGRPGDPRIAEARRLADAAAV